MATGESVTIKGSKAEIKSLPEDPNCHGHKPVRMKYLKAVYASKEVYVAASC